MKQNHYFKLFLIAVSMLFPVVASAQFGGGNGSEQDPYLIEDIDHWLELSDNVLSGETYDGVYFQMLSDIDFSILNMVQIQFIPVGGWGNENNSFAGYFDGGGYSVSGLDLAYDNFVGLFGKTTGGYIQNLNVQSGYFMGDTYIGALIGYNAGAEVYNCHVGTEVYVYGLSGNMSHMGGLIGYNAGTEVSDCSSQATIVGNTNIGGLIGYNAGETIRDCSSEGTVIGTIYVGGLIGYNIGNEVVDCYSEATVTSANSEAQIGGLIGYNEGAVSGSSSKANVSCSFRSTSSLSGTALIGGLIGHNNQAEITNCFSEAIVWSYASGNRMGGLIGQNNLASVSSSYSNAEVNATVTTLGNFIIGGLIAENSGVISDCYSIANVTVSGPTPFVAGLIGYNKGTISNCYVSKNASVTANQNSAGKVGGLTADNEVLITDSYSSATVTVRGASSSASVGGLTSYNLGTGVIRNSYVTAVAVISSEGSSATVSGLAGYTSVGSLIENCYSEATVRGQSTTNNYSCVVSGLIGIHSGEVRNSYSTGVVEGVGNYVVVGGLIGDERSGITNNCYSTATLIGTGSEVRMGGLAGFFRGSAGAVSNCYIAPKLQAGNSASRYIGIFTGMNSTNITNCYFLTIPGRGAFGGTASSTELFVKTEEELRATAMVASPGSRGSSLNFNQSQNPLPWMVDFTPNMNDGYPILSWEIQPPTVSTDTAIALTLSTALLKGTVVAGANPVLNKGFIYKRASDAKWTRVEINEIELEKELTGLPADTPYQFRAFASTADKIFYGKQKTFILRTQPIVETDTVVDITQTTATIKGIIDPGLAPITQQGFEFKIGSDEGWTVFDIPGNTPEKALENLTAYTVYQYKTFATTSFGTVYGETKSFRTKPIPPTITTDSATVITQTSATLWSTVTLGSESITEQGFYYKESTAQEWTKSTISELSNLTAYTFYDYQAFVTTASDTAYGSIETFRTRPIPPTITTDSATVITQTSATLWSTITLGSESITEQGFYYKKNTAEEWIKTINSELTGLIPLTRYEYKAFATTVSNTVYGSVQTFMTSGMPCVGFSNKYSAGPAGTEAATPDNFFTLGYSYSIKTIDEESISITFEFEDARITGNLTVFIGGVEKSPVLEKTNGKYTGAFSGYTWGQEVTISLRIARENGFSFTKPVFYIVGNDCLQPVDFVIEQTETRTKAEYWAGNYGNIIFKSVDFAIGELVIPSGETLEVNGVVKLQRTYTQERWSTIGFAFEVEDIYCESFENGRTLNVFYDENNGDFRLKKYNGIYNGFYYSFEPQGGGVYENYLIKDVGYIIQFPTTLVNKEITFASAPGITLKNIDERNIADGYSMICNYTLQNSPLTGADYYYIFEHDLKNDFELVAEGNVSNIRVKLFEAFIVAKNLTEPPRTISIYPPSDTESIFDDKGNIVEIRYYTIHGMEIKQPMPGYIYIEKRVYDTGTVEINKRIESK